MMGRLGRLKTKSAWAEDPPSRTRRFITNVLVWKTDKADELEATSYLLLARSRYEYDQYQFLSAERNDRLRRVEGGGFKLARREIVVDQWNLAVFL
jgi:3-phenylpropionate/cinnamic acid dioxygenase small subunit